MGAAGHSPCVTRICWSALSWTNRGAWIWLEFVPSFSNIGDGPTATRPSTTVTTVESCSRRTSKLVPRSTTSADPAITRNARWGSWATSKSAWPDVSITSRSVLPYRMVTALSVLRGSTELSAKRRLSCSPCRVSRCSAVIPSGADECSMGCLSFHVKSKPRLNTTHAAIATAAGSQRPEVLPLTASITRGQRGRTGGASAARARARIASRENSESVRASLRSRAIVDTARNSSMWTGEVLSHCARAAASCASNGPSSFATNHSPACSAIAARTFSSLEIIDSTQPRHAASTMTQPLRHVLFRHLRGHPKVRRDRPVGEFMREAQLHRGAAFRSQLLQHDPEPRDTLCRIEVPVECGQRLEFLVRRSRADVDAARLPPIEHRVLLHQIVGHRVEIVDGIAD